MKLLSDEENSNWYTFGRHIDDKLVLLPKRVRRVVKVKDDFWRQVVREVKALNVSFQGRR